MCGTSFHPHTIPAVCPDCGNRKDFNQDSHKTDRHSMPQPLNTTQNGQHLSRLTQYFDPYTRVEILIVASIYLQLIQNRYMFRSFTVLQCSHQHCVQPVASDVEVVGYL